MSLSWEFSLSDPEINVLMLTTFLSAILLGWWLDVSQLGEPLEDLDEYDNPERVQIIGWERDRMLGAAKGIASAAAGFLVTLLTILLKGEIDVSITGWTVLGMIAGLVGSLLLAATIAADSRSFVARHLR
jgi:hypothetical protein